MKYDSILSEKQIKIINEALELYSRLLTGQVEFVHDPFMYRIIKEDLNMDMIRRTLQILKTYLFPGMHENASHGIHGPQTDDRAQIAWDIQQVFRNRLALDAVGNPPTRNWKTMTGVQYGEPLKCGPEPLCTLKERPNEYDFLEGKDVD